jgi:phosphate transport system substrate-binding protein
MKKIFALSMIFILMFLLAACADDNGGGNSDGGGGAVNADTSNFVNTRAIMVVSREDGSGTRGAFNELFGLVVEGNDVTTDEAVISNGTNLVMTNVAGNEYAIGYASVGSLNDTVKAIHVDGVAPTAENIKNGTYPVQRPFVIALNRDTEQSDATQDFINFIFSAEGQAVAESRGYIPAIENADTFVSTIPSGRVVVNGSTSVEPVMQRLKEAYEAINSNVTIEVHSTGSGAGITSARDGTSDIGMSSRSLSAAELEDLEERALAFDGIAVIVNNGNPITNISSDSIKGIYTGTITAWNNIQ